MSVLKSRNDTKDITVIQSTTSIHHPPYTVHQKSNTTQPHATPSQPAYLLHREYWQCPGGSLPQWRHCWGCRCGSSGWGSCSRWCRADGHEWVHWNQDRPSKILHELKEWSVKVYERVKLYCSHPHHNTPVAHLISEWLTKRWPLITIFYGTYHILYVAGKRRGWNNVISIHHCNKTWALATWIDYDVMSKTR